MKHTAYDADQSYPLVEMDEALGIVEQMDAEVAAIEARYRCAIEADPLVQAWREYQRHHHSRITFAEWQKKWEYGSIALLEVSVACLNEGGEHYFVSRHEAAKFAKNSGDVCTLYQFGAVVGTFSPLSGFNTHLGEMSRNWSAE